MGCAIQAIRACLPVAGEQQKNKENDKSRSPFIHITA